MEWFEYGGLPTIGVAQEDNFIFMDISGVRKEEISEKYGLVIYLYRKYNGTKVKLYFAEEKEGEEVYKLLESTFRDPKHNLVIIAKNYDVKCSILSVRNS